MRSARLVIPGAIKPKLTRARVLAAMWECLDRCTRHASAYDGLMHNAAAERRASDSRTENGRQRVSSPAGVIVACAIAVLPTASGLITLS